MSAKLFLDTNIVSYASDKEAPDKARIAQEIIDRDDWEVSWQVLQEFANVALNRFKNPLHHEDIADYQDLVLWPRCRITPNKVVHRLALEIRVTTQYQFYDCLIVASAITANAKILYSEDMQHGREIEGLTIRNPFF